MEVHAAEFTALTSIAHLKAVKLSISKLRSKDFAGVLTKSFTGNCQGGCEESVTSSMFLVKGNLGYKRISHILTVLSVDDKTSARLSYLKVTIRLLFCITADALHAQAPCILYVYVYYVTTCQIYPT